MMKMVLLIIVSVLTIFLQDVVGQSCSGPMRGIIDGNVTLGFMFPFRGSQQGDSSCSGEVDDPSNIQLLEAARYALRDAQNTIPGITIGLEAYDTCGSSKVGIENAVSFLSDRLVLVGNEMANCPGSTFKPGMLVGGGIDMTKSVGSFLSDAHLPVIGYDTTLNEFTTSERYSYFVRALPSDRNQAMAINDLIATLGWNYVATFNSLNDADVAAYEAFKTVANRTGICISKSESVQSGDVSDNTWNNIASSFFQDLKPNGVILFLPPDQLAQFFKAFARINPDLQDLQFIIGYRGLTKPDPSMISSLPAMARDRLLGVMPASLGPNVTSGFDDFFKNLSPDNHDAMANPWFKAFWQKAYQCNIDGGNEFPSNCSDEHVQQHMTTYQRHPFVPVVLDSIKVNIEAIRMAHQQLCGAETSGICPDLQQISADYYYNNITLQVSTTGSANQPIQYKASGDLATNTFSIIGFGNGQQIGTWQDGNLTLPLSNLPQPRVNSTCGDTCLDIVCVQNKERLDQELYLPGDIIFGGMFNLHPISSDNGPCGDIDEIGIHRLEAMLYALDEINKDDGILPGIKFGMDGLDTCGNPKRAGSQALQLIADARFDTSGSGQREGAKGNTEHLFAVVGPDGDDECIKVSEVLKVYHVPVVAYAAASATLSNSYFYPNFARVLAPATNQYAAILGAIFTSGWDYIQAIHSTSSYGYNGISVLKQQAPQRQTCLTQYMTMPQKTQINENAAWDDIFRKVKVRKDAKVLVIISDDPDEFRAVLDQLIKRNMSGSYYLFASDGWPASDEAFYAQYSDHIKGVTFIGQLIRDYDGVKNYLASLQPDTNKRNPWFEEYWMNKFDCYLPGANSTSTTACTGSEQINATTIQDIHIADVVDAVYTVAYLMLKLQNQKCPGQTGICADMINTSGEEIFALIRSLQFLSANDNRLIKFDYQGNADVEFQVFNYQNGTSGFRNTQVGQYRTYTYTAQGYAPLKVYNLTSGAELVNPLSTCTGICADCKKVDKGKTAEVQFGDAYIGGFFHLHELADNEHDCKDEMIFYNMQYVEAYLYAIDEVNRDTNILPGLKLGGIAFDTCGSAKRARRDAANFISATVEYRYGYPQNRVVVSGVIGEQTSDITLALADVVTPLQVPQVSYSATSTVLDDNQTYPFFQRTVASDTFQADALLDILSQMGWTYLSIVYSDDEYGNDMYRLISERKTSSKICVAMSLKIPAGQDMEGFKSVVQSLRSNPQANVVLLLTSDFDTRDILQAAEALGINDLQWVGTDTWGSRDYVTASSPITSQGAITLQFRQNFVQGFYDYYSSLNPYSNTRNPWWKLFISQKYQCNLYGYDIQQNSEWSICAWDVNHRLTEDPQEPEVAYIILAVKAFAQGLHDAMSELCPDKTDHLCNEVIENMPMLQDKVRAARVENLFGDGSTFQFDSNGNGPAMYDILNIQKTETGSGTNYTKVGSWTSTDGLSLDAANLKFYDATGETDPTNSTCLGRCTKCNPSNDPDNYLHIDGQLQIPGLFALHEAGDHISECGDFRLSGLLNIEAMLYAIDMVNNDPDKLPGVTIGTTVFDTCLSSSRAVRDLSSLLSGFHVSLSTNQLWSSVIGVIGSESEDVTLSTAEVTGRYQYTQISYGPGDTLTPSNLFLYRAGTFASDDSKASAIIELLQHYDWTYVSMVYSSDDEDIANDIKAFTKAAANADLCIATQEMVSSNNTHSQVIDSILGYALDTVVVAFVNADDMTALQHQLVIKGDEARHLTWVLAYPYDLRTDRFIIGGVGANIRSFKGSLAIKAKEAVPDHFKQYVTSLRVNDTARNPWFKEYIDSTCGDAGSCDGSETIDVDQIDINGQLVEGIIDSVNAMTDGIDQLLKKKCGPEPSGMCSEFLSAAPEEFRNAIKSALFHREDDTFFAITDQNAIMPAFEVWNYKTDGNSFKYVQVGNWQPGNLQISDSDVDLFVGSETGTLQPGTPTSSCDDYSECAHCLPPTTTTLAPTTVIPTTVPVTTEKITTNQPTAVPATTERQTTTKATTTTTAATTPKPTKSKLTDKPKPTTAAEKPSKQPLQQIDVGASELKSAWFYAVIVFATVGMLITIALMVLVVFRWKEPIAQAMSPFLLLMVLVGVFQMFTLVIVFAVPVSAAVCAVQRIDSGIGFAMCYSAVFLMTVRLYRMGRHRTISGPKTSFIQTGSQVILFIFLTAFQIVIDIEWIILEPPKLVTRESVPTPKPGGEPLPVVGYCSYKTSDLQCSFIYIYILLVLNLGLALIARRRISHMVSMSRIQIDTILLANIGCILVMIVWVLLGAVIHADFHRLSISVLAALNGYIVLATMFLYRAKILFLNQDPFEDTLSGGLPDYGYGIKMDIPVNEYSNGSHLAFENPVATTELADLSSTSDSKELIQ